MSHEIMKVIPIGEAGEYFFYLDGDKEEVTPLTLNSLLDDLFDLIPARIEDGRITRYKNVGGWHDNLHLFWSFHDIERFFDGLPYEFRPPIEAKKARGHRETAQDLHNRNLFKAAKKLKITVIDENVRGRSVKGAHGLIAQEIFDNPQEYLGTVAVARDGESPKIDGKVWTAFKEAWVEKGYQLIKHGENS